MGNVLINEEKSIIYKRPVFNMCYPTTKINFHSEKITSISKAARGCQINHRDLYTRDRAFSTFFSYRVFGVFELRFNWGRVSVSSLFYFIFFFILFYSYSLFFLIFSLCILSIYVVWFCRELICKPREKELFHTTKHRKYIFKLT